MARASIPAQARSITIISCSLEAAVTVDDACGASSAVVVGNSGQIHRRYFRSARSNVKSEVFDHDDRVETATAKGEVQLHDWMYLRLRSCQQRIHVRPSPANMLSAIPENPTQWRWQLGACAITGPIVQMVIQDVAHACRELGEFGNPTRLGTPRHKRRAPFTRCCSGNGSLAAIGAQYFSSANHRRCAQTAAQ